MARSGSGKERPSFRKDASGNASDPALIQATPGPVPTRQATLVSTSQDQFLAGVGTLHNEAVDGAIVGFRRPEQVDPVVAAAGLELDADDLDTIEGGA